MQQQKKIKEISIVSIWKAYKTDKYLGSCLKGVRKEVYQDIRRRILKEIFRDFCLNVTKRESRQAIMMRTVLGGKRVQT